MDLKDIKAIIDLMRKNGITEFEMEKEDFKVKLKRGLAAVAASSADDAVASAYLAAPAVAAGGAAGVAVAAAPVNTGEIEIKSPMIGTFYRSPSPEAAPYIEVGTEVNPETVVCIVEAMKVMNEIKAEVKGIVTQALMENAKPVEFGQPLFKVRPL
jgi:acetyl-CoA carboxylase biotin carboxyl carrier protein